MLDTVLKNLWTLITIILPGLFTYGAWRLLLILQPSNVVNLDDFSSVDQSSTITWSIIISIALLQQAIGITIEYFLYMIANYREKEWPNFNKLFSKRFELAKSGLLNKYETSVIGNFFLSLNVLVGLLFLLCYFLYYEGLQITNWVSLLIIFFMIVNSIAIIFRMKNAINIVKE